MKYLLALVCLIFAALPAAIAQPSQEMSPKARVAWGFDASDLAPHPGVGFGVLPNGMRFAIMRNEVPAGGLSVRLRFDAGAMDEAEGEQGYLHLLEHLIFHGSDNIPPGALALMFAHRGMKRITDFNAVTSYDETVYRLDLSKSDHNARAAALMLMRDVSSRLSFTRRSVEAAKKDVVQEIAARDAVRDRVAAAQNAYFLPGTPLARGPVVGSRASIRRANAEKLRRLYQRHYVPARAVLVVVGDIDPAIMEAEIASHFADWQGSGTEAKAGRPAVKLSNQRQSQAYLFVDRAAPSEIMVASVTSLHGPSDKAPLRDAQFLERLGNEMLNRRLAAIAGQPDAPFTGASAAIYNHFSAARVASLDIAVRSRHWRGAMRASAIEMRRALDQGFSQLELDEQLALTRGALARSDAARTSPALADAIVDASGRGLIFTEPADPAATAAYLGRVRLEEVNAAFRAAWADAGQLLFVAHDRRFPAAEAEIAAAWRTGFARTGPEPGS
jgi:zinc protease